MTPGFAPPSAAGGDAQGPVDGELDADLLAYVSDFLPAPSVAPSIASPSLLDASNSGNDSGGRAALESDAKLKRQRALAAKRRRAYRERSCAELQSLRRRVAALTEQLERLTNHRVLQANATAELPQSCSAIVPGVAVANQSASGWRELAVRQREGLLAAERLCRRLKTQVTTRQAFLRDVASSLGHRAALTRGCTPTTDGYALRSLDKQQIGGASETGTPGVRPGAGSTAPQTDLSRIELADASLFETYLSELDAAYAKTDEVLRASGLVYQPDESRHQRITRKEDCGVDGYEIVDSLVVPFRFDAVRRIMWDAVVRVHGRADRQSYPSACDPSNTVAVKFALQCRPRDGDHESASGGVPLVIVLVLRRYVESAREVLVWRAFSEGMGAVEGLNSDETGWSIARAAAMPDDSPFGLDATINQTVVRFQMIRVDSSRGPYEAGSKASSAPDQDLFAKLIASSADEDGEQISRLMERLMLSEARVQDG